MSDPKLSNFLREQRRRIKRKLFPEQRRLRLTKDGDEFVNMPLTERSDPIDECDVTVRGNTQFK